MKQLRIQSPLGKALYIRPLIGIAFLVIFIDLIYVNLIWKAPVDTTMEGKSLTLSGKVRDKEYDENGVLKTVTVGNYLCYVNKINDSLDVSVGSSVTLEGTFKLFTKPLNRGQFNQPKYYASKRIYAYIYVSKLTVTKKPFLGLRELSIRTRRMLSEKVLQYCSFEAGTVNTLLLADKSNLSMDRKKLYQRVSVSHFLVISGLHVSAIGGCVYRFLRWIHCSRNKACVLSMLVLFLYGCLIGFSVSVLRALIMFFVRLFGELIKEAYDLLSSVCFALIVTLIINPLWILDTAFIYSYVTVFTIGFYITYLHPIPFRRLNPYSFMRELLRFPVVLCLCTLPVTLSSFGQYSFLSIGINSILAPASGFILFIAFFAFMGAVADISLWAKTFDFLLTLILRLFDYLSLTASKASLFYVYGNPGILKICIYYLLLISFAFVFRKFFSKLLSTVYLLSLVVFLGCPLLFVNRLSMLYVGQGECMVLTTKSHEAVMVDCGSTTEKNLTEYTVIPFLREEGINTLSGIFVTHSDKDHIGEVGKLIESLKDEGIRLKCLYMPLLIEKDDMYLETVSIAKRTGVKVAYIYSGQVIKEGNVEFHVLWPKKEKQTGDSNSDSLVLMARVKDTSVLLTGDAPRETEEKVVGNAKGTDILKVSHHGSKTATSEGFLEALGPRLAIISAGINNSYNHPDPLVLNRLMERKIDYLCTKYNGEIDIYLTCLTGKGRIKYKVMKGKINGRNK